MHEVRQSSRIPSVLPACSAAIALGAVLSVSPLLAQSQHRVRQSENFRKSPSPSAPVLARVTAGAVLSGASASGDWVEVTLDGWVWAPSLAPDPGAFDHRVSVQNGENLRAAPNGDIIARLETGTLLNEVSRSTRWVRVKRTGYMWAQSLNGLDGSSPGASRPRPRPPASASSADATLDRAMTGRRASMHRVPDGDSVGVLETETPVRILVRSGEWVKVQTEGWIRESDLKSSVPGVLEGVSGAEVRSRPEEFEGKLLQWTLQYIALQEADELRSEIPRGQRYMLARGPLPEAGFVYVTIPSDKVSDVERLGPLTQVVIVGRLRTARSRYLGNPIIELMDMAVRQQGNEP